MNEELKLKDDEHQALIGDINKLTTQLSEMKKKNEGSLLNLENIVKTFNTKTVLISKT
jgi:hypothetical protein